MTGPAVVDRDPLAEQMARVGAPSGGAPAGGDPLLAQMARVADPMAKWHAAYQSGTLQRSTAAANATDPEQYALDKAPSYTDRLGMMAERSASTLPGGATAMTATRKLATGEPWSEAAQHVTEDANEAGKNAPGVTIPFTGGSRVTVADAPMAALGFTRMLAGAPEIAASRFGIPGASAVYSGAVRATNPNDESFGSRARGTATDAALGYVVPVMAGRAGRVAANVSGKTGLTDAIAAVADRLGAKKLANSIGTRGAVNDLLKEQEAVPTALGQDGLGTGEAQLLAHAKETDRVSKQLFGQAVKDKQIINDPTVNEITENPLVQKAIGWAKSVRRLSGDEVPTSTETIPLPGPRELRTIANAPTTAQSPAPSLREGLERFRGRSAAVASRSEGTVAQQMARQALERNAASSVLNPPLTGVPRATTALAPQETVEVTTEALDPQLLHLAKQHVSDVLSGKLRGTLPGDDALSSAEAVAIEQSGVLNKLTSRLHDLSPAYKTADDYFSTRVNYQNGFEKGMELSGKPLKQAASQAATASPEAMQAWANEPNTWQNPRPDLAQQRMQGLDAGHRAGLANQVRDVPLEQGGRGVLNKPPFGNSADAVSRRGTLSTAADLQRALQDVTGTVSEREAVADRPDARFFTPWRWGNKSFDYLDAPKGAAMLQARAGTPSRAAYPDFRTALLRTFAGNRP